MSSLVRVTFLLIILAAAALLIRGALMAPAAVPASLPVPAATAAPTVRVQTSPTVAPSAARGSLPFSLTLSDDDLTRAAATAFPQTVSGITVSDPVVRVQPGGVRLVATARLLFGSTQFVLMATPTVSNGRLGVRVDSATLAGIGVPDSTRASIAVTMQSAITRLVPANVRITDVTLGSGTLTVTGAQ